jgi:hypothetical protein
MAEQAASAVASAVIGGVTDRAFTTVMRKLRSRSRSRSGPAAAHEKLQRLETLVLKVPDREARHRERLPAGVARQAAAEAGAVVLDFQRRAREDGKAAVAIAPGQQQPAGAIAPTGALYFTSFPERSGWYGAAGARRHEEALLDR